MNRLRLSAELAHLPIGNIQYCHRNRECASSAYELTEKRANILLCIPRALGTSLVDVEIYSENLCVRCLAVSGEWQEFCEDMDIYTFDIDLSKIGVGLYFFRFKIKSCNMELYSYRTEEGIFFTQDSSLNGMCQLTVTSFAHSKPKKMYGGTIYHIFVDRFMRGGKSTVPNSARIIGSEWSVIAEYPAYPGAPLKNNTFYGGTLWGIAEKLDYIASLGVTAIYLSPIFTSVSNHKYDTGDYMTVDPIFGGEDALSNLISKCDEFGIVLILDGVFNHTGADSIYFNRYGHFNSLGAYQSKKSPYYNWFDFQDYPSKYTCWWDIEILPRINPDFPECRAHFVGCDGVIAKYRDMGIYGLRLDVADELSDAFISDIKNKLSENGESILYGEVWEDASNKIAYDKRKKYYLGNELDGVMNYPLRSGIIEYITHRNIAKLKYALTDVMINAPERIMHLQMNLLGTHDTERILTVLGGEPSEGYTNAELAIKRMSIDERTRAIKKLVLAYTILATLPGIPTIFYGDEAGLEGYSDPFNRMPFPWGNEVTELVQHYRTIGAIRKRNGVYKNGGFKLYVLTPELLIFGRVSGKYVYVTVCNNSDISIDIAFNCKAISLLDGKRTEKYCIAPISAGIYKVKIDTEFEIV